MENISLVFGPHMEIERPERTYKLKPCTWQLSVKANADTIDRLDKIARKSAATRADIVRSAVRVYLDMYDPPNSTLDDQPIIDHSQAAPTPIPAKAERYRGDGKSDFAKTQEVNRTNAARKESGKGGERLVDKTPVR